MPSPNTFVTVMRILILIAAVICLGLGGFFLWVQFTFSRRKQNTAKTAGILREADHKKNVTVRTIRKKYFFKNRTKALYIYTVNGIEYGIRSEFFATKRQTPKFVPVVYNKRFPRFAYVDIIGSFSDILYGLWGVVLLAFGVSLGVGTVTFLINTYF